MAELHVVGEITGGVNFKGYSFFCTFEVIHGPMWAPVEGSMRGSTHIMLDAHDGVVWNFPVDIHLCTQSIQGWPKIAIQVWAVDAYGRKDLAGYGTCFVPLPQSSRGNSGGNTNNASVTTSCGFGGSSDGSEHIIEIPTWKPSYWHSNGAVRLYQQVRQIVMGGNPVLRDDSIIHTNDMRYKLHTVAGGTVQLRLSVVSRRMAALGIKF